MSSCWAAMVEEKGTACGLIEFKGEGSRTTAQRKGVIGMARHEGGKGQSVAGPGRGGARQGKIGGSGFIPVMGRLRKKGERALGERKEVGPALNE
jgi:hypothetical protein